MLSFFPRGVLDEILNLIESVLRSFLPALIKISALNSIPKKDTEERRVILDLSFPKGYAVNDFISMEEYLGDQIDLILPNVDDFIHVI